MAPDSRYLLIAIQGCFSDDGFSLDQTRSRLGFFYSLEHGDRDRGVDAFPDGNTGLAAASAWIVRRALERRRLRLQCNSARTPSGSSVRTANVYPASESMRGF